jgi:hypothetical protein
MKYSNLAYLALTVFIWGVCTMSLGLIARVTWTVFLIGWNAL